MNDTTRHDEAGRKWPTGDDLPLAFISNVQTWRYKGSPWDGTQVEEDKDGHYVASVLEYTDKKTWHVGWVGATWAEAFAAIGAALDVSAIAFLERHLAETREELNAQHMAGEGADPLEIKLLQKHEAAVLKRIEMERRNR